jgi:hypothetical protein
MLTTVTTTTLLRQCHRLLLLAVLAAPVLASAAVPEPGAETLQAFRRMQCSLEDGKPAVYGWTGRTYSRVPGEPDRLLFQVTGMNIRACESVTDKDKGTGFRMVSREILLYLDPQTGEILETWENPWTGETVDVIQIENDPVNQRPMYATGRDGKPMTLPIESIGDQWWMTSTIPLFYENALGGPFQDYIGGKYHATEMFNFFGDVADLAMDAGDSSAVRVGWERISDWLPWMKMRSRVGILYFHTSGRKLDSFEQLPDLMKDFIDANYPKYREPPPLDDTRPNETSWTYFKKVLSETDD